MPALVRLARPAWPRVRLAALLGLALMGLSACDRRDDGETAAAQATASAPSPAASQAALTAPAASGASATQGDAGAPLAIAFVYRGPVGDGGWTLSHDLARQALEQAFGDRIRTTQVESVSEPADALRVMRGLAGQGNQLIFGTARRHGDAMHQIAADFPGVKFESVSALEPRADNVASYDVRSDQGAYMAGVVAGAMTQSNTLGVVAAEPTPDALRNIDSFTLGAQRTNPAITTRVVWVGEWFNPPKESDAAATLINGGADILLPFTDSSAVLKTAEKMGKRGFGWNADMSAQAPKAHIASAIVDWTPYYRERVAAALSGRWKAGQHWWGVKEGAVDLVSLAPDVPESARKALDEVRAGLQSGKLKLWRGPITDNQGTTVLEKGQTADDAFLRGIGFYVQGVEGEVPALR